MAQHQTMILDQTGYEMMLVTAGFLPEPGTMVVSCSDEDFFINESMTSAKDLE